MNWKKNPVTLSYVTEFAPISDVPFPALTICVPVQFTGNGKPFLFESLMELAKNNKIYNDTFDLFRVIAQHNIVYFLKSPAKDNFQRASPFPEEWYRPEDVFGRQGCLGVVSPFYQYPCEDVTQRMWTRNGMCFSFNMLPDYQIYKGDT